MLDTKPLSNQCFFIPTARWSCFSSEEVDLWQHQDFHVTAFQLKITLQWRGWRVFGLAKGFPKSLLGDCVDNEKDTCDILRPKVRLFMRKAASFLNSGFRKESQNIEKRITWFLELSSTNFKLRDLAMFFGCYTSTSFYGRIRQTPSNDLWSSFFSEDEP